VGNFKIFILPEVKLAKINVGLEDSGVGDL